jgi:hypothetical protein
MTQTGIRCNRIYLLPLLSWHAPIQVETDALEDKYLILKGMLQT